MRQAIGTSPRLVPEIGCFCQVAWAAWTARRNLSASSSRLFRIKSRVGGKNDGYPDIMSAIFPRRADTEAQHVNPRNTTMLPRTRGWAVGNRIRPAKVREAKCARRAPQSTQAKMTARIPVADLRSNGPRAV